jgi:hypothetical protein
MDDPAANKERKRAQVKLDEAMEGVDVLKLFYQDVSTRWATPECRILGHAILSPPISVGSSSEGCIEGWGVIEVDTFKIDVNNFTGNAIHLSTRLSLV